MNATSIMSWKGVLSLPYGVEGLCRGYVHKRG